MLVHHGAAVYPSGQGGLEQLIKMSRQIYVPPGGPPQGPPPDPEIYRIMGEVNIFKMMSDFYKELEKSEVRPLFPADMEEASKKSAAFFVGILGGPPLYAVMTSGGVLAPIAGDCCPFSGSESSPTNTALALAPARTRRRMDTPPLALIPLIPVP